MSKIVSWLFHGNIPSAQIFPVYLSRIWCQRLASMGAGSPMGAHPEPRYSFTYCVMDMVSKHGNWLSHGSTPSAQIYPVYLSRIWYPSIGAGSPMGAHPGPRYFLYICLGYGVQAWDLVLPWEHTQGPDISCIYV